VAGMTSNLKKCGYCQRLHPEDDFVKRLTGRGGKVAVVMCGPCHRRRKDAARNKVEFALMVENNKLANKRAYGNFEKEKSR